jgi:integrase
LRACSPARAAARSPQQSCATRTRWDEVVTALGYGHLRRHDLRHTGLTWMADPGVPVHVLRKIAGHGSLTTTQRCLHPDHRDITRGGEALSAYLNAG